LGFSIEKLPDEIHKVFEAVRLRKNLKAITLQARCLRRVQRCLPRVQREGHQRGFRGKTPNI
jgi:hypothetical protein